MNQHGAKAYHKTSVETASKESYAATRAFYERIGYVEVARTPDFYKDGDDRVVYSRRLAPRPVTA